MRNQGWNSSSGWTFILGGLAFCAITLIAIAISGAVGTEPVAGRGASLIELGIPIGVVAIAIGVVKLIRQRRR